MLAAPEADPRSLAVGYGMLHSCLTVQELLGDAPAYDRITLTWDACEQLPPQHTHTLRIQLAGDVRLDQERVSKLLRSLSLDELSRYDVECLLALLKVLPQRFASQELMAAARRRVSK